MPPSPLLSARIITDRYLKAITQAIDQVMSERSPSTFSRVGAMPCSALKHSLSA